MKIWVYDCPVLRVPDPHVPLFDVTVCGTPVCWFVQVTVLFTPITTVMWGGRKE